MASQDSFGAKGTLDVDGKSYEIFRLGAVIAGVESLDRGETLRGATVAV